MPKPYPREFRRAVCARLVAGEKVSSLSPEPGVSEATLYLWKRQALVAAWAEGKFDRKIRTCTAPSVLIIDDVGVRPFDPTPGPNPPSKGEPAVRPVLGDHRHHQPG
ncbi:MAG TPA: transposase, partial [Acidimicrobiales bacterium]